MLTEIIFLDDGEERLIPRISPSVLPREIIPVLAVLSHS
jgi:hypothetical protein